MLGVVIRSFDMVFAVRADTMEIEKCLPSSALVHIDSSSTPVTEPNRRMCTSSAMPIGPRSGWILSDCRRAVAFTEASWRVSS